MDGGDVSVDCVGLSRKFGPTVALDGVDIRLDEPEILGLAGPNGSGKTTLIRCLLGLLAPSAGTSAINGVPSLELGLATRGRIGFMPQREAVYSDLTVRQNVAFFARLYGLSNRREAVERALSFVELGDRADDRLRTLSGGLIRRVSLACTLVHDPDVIVLDEPTVGVDPVLRASMWRGFRERRDDGAIVIVSTHYLGEATNCDRVLFLRDGRTLAVDTPDAFLASTGAADLESAFLELLEEG
ncbi:ABC transporter ATP-binding protein [Haloferax chudinovii]|uniref:ABC transporter ATP-binding protein n=1 Tax=Haloferax chudinovii TaxID=1109010 RepID=A0ABD5XQ51_9EURY